jgi:peptidyl-prolyl cis-trans isomerase C
MSACSSTNSTDSNGPLAEIGDTRIDVGDLLSFEQQVAPGDTLSIADHRGHLTTLIDRYLLIAEARARRLEQDTEIVQALTRDANKKLAELMFEQEVAERANPTLAEINEAYASGHWNEQVVSVELFLSDQQTALRVRQEIIDGLDIYEAGKLYSLDRLMHLPMGGAQQFMYSRHDGPKEIVERVFQIPVGNISSPIPFLKGYVLSYVAEYREVERDAVNSKIKRHLRKKKREILRGAYLNHLNKTLQLDFSDVGLAAVVEVLSADRAASWNEESVDTTLVVYSFKGDERRVGEVAQLLKGAARRWEAVTPTEIVAELKNKHLPNLLMAEDARRTGVEKKQHFLEWYNARRDDLLLSLLRKEVVDTVSVDEQEILDHYKRTKKRFRSLGYAKVRDLLVATETEAKALKLDLDDGADFVEMIRGNSIRKKAHQNVFRVFALQAKRYGTAWMNYVMNIPVGEIHGPVGAEGGYSLVQVVERYADSYYTLEESRVRTAVTRDMRNLKQRRVFNAFVADLRERQRLDGLLVIYEERLAGLVDR